MLINHSTSFISLMVVLGNTKIWKFLLISAITRRILVFLLSGTSLLLLMGREHVMGWKEQSNVLQLGQVSRDHTTIRSWPLGSSLILYSLTLILYDLRWSGSQFPSSTRSSSVLQISNWTRHSHYEHKGYPDNSEPDYNNRQDQHIDEAWRRAGNRHPRD